MFNQEKEQKAVCAAPTRPYANANLQAQCGQATQAVVGLGAYRQPTPTLREESEKRVGYHREQADKHDRGAAFFRENPAFDEFIRLIRAGAIQF
jgi:hypothetical protein